MPWPTNDQIQENSEPAMDLLWVRGRFNVRDTHSYIPKHEEINADNTIIPVWRLVSKKDACAHNAQWGPLTLLGGISGKGQDSLPAATASEVPGWLGRVKRRLYSHPRWSLRKPRLQARVTIASFSWDATLRDGRVEVRALGRRGRGEEKGLVWS